MKRLLTSAAAIALFGVFGCQTETDNVQPTTIQPSAPETSTEEPVQTYAYRLDGEYVKEGAFNPEDERLHIALTGEPSKDGSEILITVDAFTSADRYIDWGNQYGYNVEGMLEFESVMSAYAEESGTIKEYEATGEVSQAYYDYENEQYERIFGKREEAGGKMNSLAMLHKDYFGGSSWPMATTAPFMMPGWNNTVSRYFQFNIYGVFIMYDRSFYRNRMFTLWGWGWQNVRLWGPLGWANDRMSSGFSF